MNEPDRKPDSAEIKAFVEALQQQSWLGYRSWWPRFGFHFTDIQSAVEIIKRGRLISRQRILSGGPVSANGADPADIEPTQTENLDMVRFTFRPRTPAQYNSEGMRPEDQLSMDAQVPVPVFLLFDLVDLLTRCDCTVSDRSMAKYMFDQGCDAAFLRQMPFKDIYDDSPLPVDPVRKSEMKARRQAEILIPREIDLGRLQGIHCRSAAEKDTLLTLLPEAQAQRWKDRIYSDSRWHLFYKRWTFVDWVSLGKSQVQIRFSPDTRTPGPFLLKIDVDGVGTRTKKAFDVRRDTGSFALTVRLPQPASHYVCTIWLDSHLAYRAEFVDYDIPF